MDTKKPPRFEGGGQGALGVCPPLCAPVHINYGPLWTFTDQTPIEPVTVRFTLKGVNQTKPSKPAVHNAQADIRNMSAFRGDTTGRFLQKPRFFRAS